MKLEACETAGKTASDLKAGKCFSHNWRILLRGNSPLIGWGLFFSNERSQFEITKNRTKYDSFKFCFANRIVNIWNSLPSYVVSAETVKLF